MQSFHPVISNTSLYDRMFRIKPYTKCIDCLTKDKLKCKRCMQQIIQDISKHEQPKKLTKIRQVYSQKFLKSKYVQYQKQEDALKKCVSVSRSRDNKQNQDKIMIKSKYNWWMQERLRRKQSQTSFRDYWPRKTRMNDFNLQHCGAKQPKFQKWEKKLLDKLLVKPSKTAQ